MAAYENFFMDGFDTPSVIGEIAGDWSDLGGNSLQTPTHFGSRRALRIVNGTSCGHTLPAAYDYVVAGARGFVNAISSPFNFLNLQSTGTARIRLTTTGSSGDVNVIVGASTTLFTVASYILNSTVAYYELEVYRHATLGFIGVYRDGNLIGSFTGDTTGIGGTMNRLRLGSVQGAPNVTDWRDVYFAGVSDFEDDIGGHNLGPFRVREIPPTADDAVQFTRSTGDDNFANVDDLPSNADTDHNESATESHEDIFTHAGVGEEGAIFAVGVSAVARKSAAGTMGLRTAIISGTERVNGALYVPPETYRVRLSNVLLADPDGGGAWTAEKVDALKFGYQNEPD